MEQEKVKTYDEAVCGDVKFSLFFSNRNIKHTVALCASVFGFFVGAITLNFISLQHWGLISNINPMFSTVIASGFAAIFTYKIWRSGINREKYGTRYVIYQKGKPIYWGCERVELRPWLLENDYNVIEYKVHNDYLGKFEHWGMSWLVEASIYLKEEEISMPEYVLSGKLSTFWLNVVSSITQVTSDFFAKHDECDSLENFTRMVRTEAKEEIRNALAELPVGLIDLNVQ